MPPGLGLGLHAMPIAAERKQSLAIDVSACPADMRGLACPSPCKQISSTAQAMIPIPSHHPRPRAQDWDEVPTSTRHCPWRVESPFGEPVARVSSKLPLRSPLPLAIPAAGWNKQMAAPRCAALVDGSGGGGGRDVSSPPPRPAGPRPGRPSPSPSPCPSCYRSMTMTMSASGPCRPVETVESRRAIRALHHLDG